MTKTAINFVVWGILLVLFQALVFNHICIMNVAMAFIYIYLIMRLPLTLSPNWVLTIAFFMGLAVDVFSDTYGMNSLSATLMAAVRRPVLRAYLPREEDLGSSQPSIRTLGFATFVKYVLTLSLIFCSVLFLIESFSFFNPVRIVLRIACSTILTSLILISIDSLTLRQSEKRL